MRQKAWFSGNAVQSFYGIDELFKMQDGYCYLCGGLMYLDTDAGVARATIDHVIPLSRGGTNDDDNRKAAHRGCNVWKRNALLEELPPMNKAALTELGAQHD